MAISLSLSPPVKWRPLSLRSLRGGLEVEARAVSRREVEPREFLSRDERATQLAKNFDISTIKTHHSLELTAVIALNANPSFHALYPTAHQARPSPRGAPHDGSVLGSEHPTAPDPAPQEASEKPAKADAPLWRKEQPSEAPMKEVLSRLLLVLYIINIDTTDKPTDYY